MVTSRVKKIYKQKSKLRKKIVPKRGNFYFCFQKLANFVFRFKHFTINKDFTKGFLASVTIGGILLYTVLPYGPASAATYTFTQTSWAGGATANSAVHASNQSGWTEYSAKDSALSVVNAGADLQLGTTSSTVVQTNEGATNTGFNLAGYSHSSTQVSGTGSNASVQLTTTGVVAWQTPVTVDSTGSVGTGSSIVIGTDGFARISYIDSTNSDIKFIQCTNLSCSSNNTTIIDSTVVNPSNTSIVLYSNNYAGISYYNGSYLKFIQCTNASCSSKTTTTVDSTGAQVGLYTSVVMGLDGYPRISYFDNTNANLKYVQCTTASCSGKNIATLDSTGIVGQYTSIAIGLDGFARISYFDSTNGDLKFAQCNDDACSAPTLTAIDQTSGTMGKWNSIGIGTDGFARISYYGGNDLKFIQCTNAACSTLNTTTIDAGGVAGEYTSLKIASDGFARISYYDGTNGDLKYAECTNDACSTSSLSALDSGGVVGQFTSLAFGSDNLPRISYYDVTNVDLKYVYQATTYNTPGTFVSGPIDLSSGVTWGNLSWTASGGQTVTLKARSDADGNFADAPNWDAVCTNITSGNALSTGGCVTDGQRYIQYQAVLSTADSTITPSLNDVTIGYSAYTSSATLTSSAYDSGDAVNVIGGLSWTEDTSLPANTTVTVSLRTASTSGELTGSWTDFTNATSNCTKLTGTVTCTSSAIPAGMKDGLDDRWVQYKVTLATSDGVSTPTLSQVVITYVVNAPPQFDTTFDVNGLSVSQITDSGDANWGKMQIQYKIRDTDTTTGTTSPNVVTPTFEYNTGAGWTSITSGYLNSGATTNKTVEEVTYTTYTAYWDVVSQISGTDTTTAQVRVTINDNEAANNTATATDTNISIDTTDPTVTTFTINSTAETVTIAASDTNNLQYRLSNNADFSADGLNVTSGEWQTVGANSVSTSLSWVFTGAPSYEIVYIEVRDSYGNVTATSAKAPNASNSIDIKDVSNATTEEYREFIAWTVYTPANDAAFGSYKIYRSTDGASYSLLTTITDVAVNYYADSTVSTGTIYYYKVQTIDSNGDISGYSSVVSDDPDGQGGTDVTAPTITLVTAATVQATWAKITWTTADELSNSFVDYSISPSTAFGTTTSVASMSTSHTVTLTGLTPNTTYLYRVRSADVFTNSATDNNLGAGYSFTTLPGTIISDVTTESVTETTAVIIWNTDSDSNSYVDYATTTSALDSGVGVTEVGVSTLVGSVNNGLYQHRVTVTGLTQRTDYYYYVKSTDSNENTATDTNSNAYYTFTTTYDNQPPVISDIATPVLTSSIAVVTWNTDELANAQVEYGDVTGVYGSTTALDNTLSISHAVTITGLTESTIYYYRIISADAKGNTATSSEQTFETTDSATPVVAGGGGGGCYIAPSDSTAPSITNIETSDIGMFGATVKFTTNESAIGFIMFGEAETYGYTIASPDFGTTHSLVLFGLKPGQTYHFRAKAIDKTGNTTTDTSDKTFNTLNSQPVIKSVELTEANAFTAIVNITTDVPTRTFVQYGESEKYEYTAGSSELATSHSVKLVGLKLGTNYHFKAEALDANGVLTSDDDQKFITKFIAEQGELLTVKTIEQFQDNLEDLISSLVPSIKPPLVTDVKVIDITTDSATVTWNTNIKASSVVALASEDLYQPESGSSYQTEIGDAGERTTTHTVVLQNLLSDTTYHIQVKSQSIVSIIGKSQDITFTTKALKIEPTIASVELDTIRVVWTTRDSATSVVEYRNNTTGAVKQSISNEQIRYHDVLLTGLEANTTYGINVSGVNSKGNELEAAKPLVVATGNDKNAPIITNLKINSALMPGRADRVQTVITWQTDEPSTTVIEYADGAGLSSEALKNKVDNGKELVTNHSIIISSLKPGALYRLRVTSADAYNNVSITPTRTIVTPQKTESILDVIVKNFEESFGFLRR